MHSCLSASRVLWHIRMESVWLMFSGWLSSLPTVVSSRSHSTEAAGSLEAGKHCFPSRLSGGLCQRWLNQPFGQTLQQPADLSLPIVSPLSKIRLLQRVVSCCVGVFIVQFPPLGLFFLSPTGSEFLLFGETEVQKRDDFSTQIPFLQSWFSYRMYRSCSQLFLLRS